MHKCMCSLLRKQCAAYLHAHVQLARMRMCSLPACACAACPRAHVQLALVSGIPWIRKIGCSFPVCSWLEQARPSLTTQEPHINDVAWVIPPISARQAVRGSASAPYYFDDFVIGEDRFQDGAAVANNPAVIALQQVCTFATDKWPEQAS